LRNRQERAATGLVALVVPGSPTITSRQNDASRTDRPATLVIDKNKLVQVVILSSWKHLPTNTFICTMQYQRSWRTTNPHVFPVTGYCVPTAKLPRSTIDG
jgi:hypothetical protein